MAHCLISAPAMICSEYHDRLHHNEDGVDGDAKFSLESTSQSLGSSDEDDYGNDSHSSECTEKEPEDNCYDVSHRTVRSNEASHRGSRSGRVACGNPTATATAPIIAKSFVIIEITLLLVFVPSLIIWRFHSYYENKIIPLFKVTDFVVDNKHIRSSSELTYYHRKCDVADDMTASSPQELIIDPNADSTTAADQIAYHGVGMFPNVLSNKTATELRNFIVEENTHKESWFVLEQEHRYTWGLHMDLHPSVNKAIEEIASHGLLIPTIEKLVGKDPAILEFAIIASSYGAKDQDYHPDVFHSASAAKFARTFTSPHTVFIPLQDTTYEMGSTQICPGSHLCSEAENHCIEHGFPISGYGNSSLGEGDDGIWHQGWAVVYNQQTHHRGSAYIDPDGPDRVLMTVTFVSRPTPSDQRQISLGGTYSIPWNLWGNALSDFLPSVQSHTSYRMKEPLNILRSLGLIGGKGWNLIDTISTRLPNEDCGFSPEEFANHVKANSFWFIPKSWRGTTPSFPIKKKLKAKGASFLKFLNETIEKTTTGMTRIYGYFLSIYILSCLCTAKYQGSTWCHRRIRRMISVHLVLAIVVFGMFNKLEEQTRRDTFFQLPRVNTVTRKYASLQPAVHPVRQDILISKHYASKQLGAYSKILDLVHPGNKQFLQLLHESAIGYQHLPLAVQERLQDYVVSRTHITSRFLKQDPMRRWVEIVDRRELNGIVHKRLLMLSNPLSATLLTQLDAIKADAEWEYRSGLAIAPISSQHLEDQLLESPPSSKKSPLEPLPGRSCAFCPRGFFKSLPRGTSPVVLSRSWVPRLPKPKEPFDGAWLKEGDVLEGMLRCMGRAWNRGRLYRIHAHNATYDIDYDDGNFDRGLAATCIRRFIPFALDDIVRMIPTDGTKTVRCKVVKVRQEGDTYDLSDTKSGSLYVAVPARQIRRIIM